MGTHPLLIKAGLEELLGIVARAQRQRRDADEENIELKGSVPQGTHGTEN